MYDYFENRRFFKVLNAANYRDGWEYDDGINDLRNIINSDNKPFYSYFTNIKNILYYLNYGPCFREVFIPTTVPFIYTSIDEITQFDKIEEFYFNYIKLGPIKLFNCKNIKWLIENGADISCNGTYYIIEWALMHDFETFYYLQDLIGNTEAWKYKIEEIESRGFL